MSMMAPGDGVDMFDLLKKPTAPKTSAPVPSLDRPLKADSPAQAAIKQGLKGVPFEQQVAMLTPVAEPTTKSPMPVRTTPLGQHTLLGEKHPAKGAAKVKPDDEKTPMSHPLYPVFMARLKGLFAEIDTPFGSNLQKTGNELWTSLCQGIVEAHPHMDATTTPGTYLAGSKGKWVDMSSPGYAEAMKALEAVCARLKSTTRAQFMKAQRFGLWSKPEGKELAKQNTDLTLETSGIGSLFDGMGQSIEAHANGWDAHLWGALSRAYSEAVVAAFDKKNKQIHVFAGGGTDKSNIFANIESKAIEKGLHGLRRPLESAVTFHAVAAVAPDKRIPDYAIQHGSVPGTWYSGPDWNVALAIGQARWDALNKKVQPEQKDAAGNPIPKGVGAKTGAPQGPRVGFQTAQALGDRAKDPVGLGRHRRVAPPTP